MGPTVAYCSLRVWGDPGKLSKKRGPCESAPGFGCACGLHARYDPIQEAHPLPYVVGSILAWGQVIHHENRSFFRAEKALPVAFVRPREGSGVFTRETKEKFSRVTELLGASVVEGPEELRVYTEEEASKW